MGDLFRRETAERPEPFTGERLTASKCGQVQIEHYHRYLFARSLVSSLDVLDVASGEGYGSALLAQVARRVIGIDYAGSTVRAAASNFPRRNLHFLQGDGRALPLADDSVDAVVSFETIEHFDRQDDFVREARRVLRPDGVFVVSTPDRDVYSPVGTPANPFHVRELTRGEFVTLLGGAFRHVDLMQQRSLIGSALLANSGSSAAPLVFDRRGDTHFEACAGLPRAPYVIAVASDRKAPPLPASLYIDRDDLDTDALYRGALAEQLRRAQADLAQAMQALEQARQQTGSAILRAERAESASADAEQRNEALQRRCDLLQGSLRTFLRSYLPRLRRHLFDRRT